MQDVDVDPPVGGVAQPGDQLLVGDEVGGGDADAVLGQLEEGPEQRGDVAPAGLRRAADALGDGVARLGLLGEPVDAVFEEDRVGLGPVVEEGGPEAVHGRALEPEVGVAPLGFVPGVAFPLVGDADAAGEAARPRRRSAPCGASGG